MHALGRDCIFRIKFFTYYAGIMPDAFLYLLCSKLCWHNWLRPKLQTQVLVLGSLTMTRDSILPARELATYEMLEQQAPDGRV